MKKQQLSAGWQRYCAGGLNIGGRRGSG